MLNKLLKYIFIIFLFSCFTNCYSFPNNSIYNLNSKLIDKDGNEIILGNLSGKIHVFSMIYTRCKTICPIIIANMKSIEKLIPEKLQNSVSFSLISLDPERDSVETLNKFFNEKQLSDKWNIFKSTKEETLKIALAMGIKYKKEKNDEYTHSNLIIILDKNGVIKMHHQGLDKNYKLLIKKISEL